MTIQHNTNNLMDNLRIDEIQVYGAPTDIHTVYLDHFTRFFDFQFDAVSIGHGFRLVIILVNKNEFSFFFFVKKIHIQSPVVQS